MAAVTGEKVHLEDKCGLKGFLSLRTKTQEPNVDKARILPSIQKMQRTNTPNLLVYNRPRELQHSYRHNGVCQYPRLAKQ